MRPFGRFSAAMRAISPLLSVKSNTLIIVGDARLGSMTGECGDTLLHQPAQRDLGDVIRLGAVAISARTGSLNNRPRPSGQ